MRLQPYKQLSLNQDEKNKLAPQFYAPYQINKNISRVVYALESPATSHIHNFFMLRA